MESAAEYKGVARGPFLDIEGAFDGTSFEELTEAAGRHTIEFTICRRI
jgi:hypothetical protein